MNNSPLAKPTAGPTRWLNFSTAERARLAGALRAAHIDLTRDASRARTAGDLTDTVNLLNAATECETLLNQLENV